MIEVTLTFELNIPLPTTEFENLVRAFAPHIALPAQEAELVLAFPDEAPIRLLPLAIEASRTGMAKSGATDVKLLNIQVRSVSDGEENQSGIKANSREP